MNLFKKSLHVWISLTSFAGFLAGWIFLAQAARQTVNNNTNLARLLSGLLRRCRSRVYLGLTELSESGYEQRGIMIRAFQQILQKK